MWPGDPPRATWLRPKPLHGPGRALMADLHTPPIPRHVLLNVSSCPFPLTPSSPSGSSMIRGEVLGLLATPTLEGGHRSGGVKVPPSPSGSSHSCSFSSFFCYCLFPPVPLTSYCLPFCHLVPSSLYILLLCFVSTLVARLSSILGEIDRGL